MSWLFSRALVAEYSAAPCSAGAPSAPSSASPTPQAYLSSDRTTAFSRPSRSGMTFAPLTDALGAELLTWFLAASRVRTSRPPARAPASTGNDPACGDTWRESSARYDRATCSWRTHRCLWDEVLSACSLTLPKWGSMRDGVLYQPLTSARPTGGNAAGSWPTPTVNGNYNRKGASATSGDGLATAVKAWPTPVASMSKGSSPNALTRKNGKDRSNDRLDHAVMARDGGQLNPTWVEWLMGWPLGWTDLRPLAMDRSARGGSSMAGADVKAPA